jgi:hypothetical protein
LITVTIINWNPRMATKRGLVLSKSFVTDQKMVGLRKCAHWLYLNLLLVCADYRKGTIEVSEGFVKSCLWGRHAMTDMLNELQSLQLLTWEFCSQRDANLSPTEHQLIKNRHAEQVTKPKKQTKKQPIIVEAKTPEEVYKLLDHDQVERWVELYDSDKDFLRRELLKAFNYYEANPRKKPKTIRGWKMVLSSWYERAWAWRAKKTKGEVQGSISGVTT